MLAAPAILRQSLLAARGAIAFAERVAPRAPRPGEALIRVTRIGLGSTDTAIAAGRLPFSGVMGREFVGVVEHLEPADPGTPGRIHAGQRVIPALAIACGACELCRGGVPSACPARVWPGARGCDGVATGDLVAYPAASLFPIPASVTDDAAMLAPSLALAMSALRAAQAESKGFLTILGDGLVALLAAQVASPMNARVRLLGKHAVNMAVCERWGIKHRPVTEAGRRQDQHIVIDCTKSADGLDWACRFVRPRGRIVMISHPWLGAGQSPGLSEALANEVTVVGGSAHSPAEAINLLAGAKLDTGAIPIRKFPFADALNAIRSAAEPTTLKVVLDCGA